MLLLAAALICLGWLGWIVYGALSHPVPAAVYAATAGSAGAANVGGFELEGASPVPMAPAPAGAAAVGVAAEPTMAYTVPKGLKPGTFTPPVGGYVMQVFGPTDVTIEPPLTYAGVSYPHFHTGIDIDAPLGTPVGASAAGVVTSIGVSNGTATGYGNYVVIQHPNGYVTLYGHLLSVTVTLGENVKQLQLIGYIGSTGLSTGPHLHFEIRRNGYLLDPLPYLLGRTRATW